MLEECVGYTTSPNLMNFKFLTTYNFLVKLVKDLKKQTIFTTFFAP